MTRARDIASVLSAATDLATDSELTSAISSSYSSSATITNKIIDGNSNTVHVKRGSTASRPLTATVGDQYYDTTDNILYNYRYRMYSQNQNIKPIIDMNSLLTQTKIQSDSFSRPNLSNPNPYQYSYNYPSSFFANTRNKN